MCCIVKAYIWRTLYSNLYPLSPTWHRGKMSFLTWMVGCCGAACGQKTVKQMQQFSLVMSLYFKVFLVIVELSVDWAGAVWLSALISYEIELIASATLRSAFPLNNSHTLHSFCSPSGIHSEYKSLKEALQTMKNSEQQLNNLLSEANDGNFFTTKRYFQDFLQKSFC